MGMVGLVGNPLWNMGGYPTQMQYPGAPSSQGGGGVGGAEGLGGFNLFPTQVACLAVAPTYSGTFFF